MRKMDFYILSFGVVLINLFL